MRKYADFDLEKALHFNNIHLVLYSGKHVKKSYVPIFRRYRCDRYASEADTQGGTSIFR